MNEPQARGPAGTWTPSLCPRPLAEVVLKPPSHHPCRTGAEGVSAPSRNEGGICGWTKLPAFQGKLKNRASWLQGHRLSQAALMLLDNARPITRIIRPGSPQAPLTWDTRQEEMGDVEQRFLPLLGNFLGISLPAKKTFSRATYPSWSHSFHQPSLRAAPVTSPLFTLIFSSLFHLLLWMLVFIPTWPVSATILQRSVRDP